MKTYGNNADEIGAMGNGGGGESVRTQEKEILEEAKVEPIASVMRRRMLQWFGHIKRGDETENIRAVAEMKMDEKRPRGKPKVAVVQYNQKGPESLENQGGMGH